VELDSAFAKAGPLADFGAYAQENKCVPGIAFIVAQESADSSLTGANTVFRATRTDEEPCVVRRGHTPDGSWHDLGALRDMSNEQKSASITTFMKHASPK
jgi:hypothetical protein